jgi:hypothetical protein
MPIAITFFAGQGDESTLIKISAPEPRRITVPPPAFGPVPRLKGGEALCPVWWLPPLSIIP